MAGASEQTLRVRVVNANYEAGSEPGDPGGFALLVVTEDDERHVLEPPAADVAGLLAMVAAPGPLLFDPVNRTLIATGLLGEWLPEDWSGLAGPG